VAGTGSIDHGDVKGGYARYIGKELAGGGRSFISYVLQFIVQLVVNVTAELSICLTFLISAHI
jgi:hypothetical protein